MSTEQEQPGSGVRNETGHTTTSPGTQAGRLVAPGFLATMGDGPISDGENARTEGGLAYNMAVASQFDPNRGSVTIDNRTVPGLVETQNRPTLGSEKAFILGPVRAPIPAKLVTQIVSHKYIELSELSPKNLEEPHTEVMSFAIEGSAIVPCSKAIPRKKQDAMDILTWVEAFNSYAAVLNSYFPHRARDLSAYMALIIRTAKRFGGRAWLQYDRTFRREAEASFLQDWSAMKPDLYKYYTAAHGNSSSPLHAQTSTKRFRREPRGSPESRCHRNFASPGRFP